MTSKIVRVFPRRTAMTPSDPLVVVGYPPLSLWRPEADEVHVSVTFTWDIEEGQRLAQSWGQYYPCVKLGGPAIDNTFDKFMPGRYVKPGVTFTTRGCDNNCPWCLVPGREGKLQEIDDFVPGYIIQDNNLLQASHAHLTRVFSMLKKQRKAAVFSGGLDARRIDDWVIDNLRGLRITQLFLAADTDAALKPLEKALQQLSFLSYWKKRVYCMIGFDGETVEQAEARLEHIWGLGGIPFAILHQPSAKQRVQYPQVWKTLAWKWAKPAAMAADHGGWPKKCSQ